MAEGYFWQQIYRHDGNGNPQSGDIEELVRAVQMGTDIQIRYYVPDRVLGAIEWHRTAFSTTVLPQGEQGMPIVSSTVTGIIDTELSAKDGRTVAAPLAEEWHVYNTTGIRQKVTIDQNTREVLDDEIARMSMAWYIRSADIGFKYIADLGISFHGLGSKP